MRYVVFLTLVLLANPTLAGTSYFQCQFPAGVFWNLTDRGFAPKVASEMAFDVRVIDARLGKGEIIGNAGKANAVVFAGASSLTITETTPAGGRAVLTIYLGDEQHNVFRAVYSRHVGTGATPPVSQFIGSCLAANSH